MEHMVNNRLILIRIQFNHLNKNFLSLEIKY